MKSLAPETTTSRTTAYSMPEEEEDSDIDEELQPISRRGAGRGSRPAVNTFEWDPQDYNFNGYFASSPEPSPGTSSTGARAAAVESPHTSARRSLNDTARAGASAAARVAARNPARHPHHDAPRPVRQAGPFRSLSGQAPVASTLALWRQAAGTS